MNTSQQEPPFHSLTAAPAAVASTATRPLFTLSEQADVFADAAASDHTGQLLFLSVFGRDTSIQQLIARIHQPSSAGGIDQVSLHEPGRAVVPAVLKMLVGDPARLTKLTGRMPRNVLLGNLVHAWLFDPDLVQPNLGTRSGWVFDTTAHAVDLPGWRWRLVKQLSPLPLLDTWCEPVLARLRTAGALHSPPRLGVHAERVALPEDFVVWASQAVREGALEVPGA
jgi:hypothetical protein